MVNYYVDCGTEQAEIIQCTKREADWVCIKDYIKLENEIKKLKRVG